MRQPLIDIIAESMMWQDHPLTTKPVSQTNVGRTMTRLRLGMDFCWNRARRSPYLWCGAGSTVCSHACIVDCSSVLVRRIHLHAGFVRAHIISDTDTYSQMLLIVERTQAIPRQQISPIVDGQDKSVVVVVASGRQLMTRHHALWSLSGWWRVGRCVIITRHCHALAHTCAPAVHGGGGSQEALRIDEVKAKKTPHIKLTLIVIIEFISY